MENVKPNELKKCIIKEFDEFKEIIEEITNGEFTCMYELDGISIVLTGKVKEVEREMNTEDILEKLSKYFDTKVTSFHVDDCEYHGVWICYDDIPFSSRYEITKEKIKNGLEKRTISIVDSDGTYGCLGICCRIGQNEFYFASSEDDGISLEEYWKRYSIDDTVDALYECLKDEDSAELNGLSEDEYNYYKLILY